MKSLKKTLSLVLVLVMVLGMFGIASASSFTDDSSIQYKEAVDVMTGIGAINGYTDGSFKPTGTINRAEAAKMVTYMVLGASVADTLTGVTSSFIDMSAPAYKWAIPYVEYLYQRGIIDGVGNSKFNPGGNVTGYELGKMLLMCLGIDGEYTGTGWTLPVAINAAKAGIYDDRASTANKLGDAASREEAALYCFNALTYSTATSTKTETHYLVYAVGSTNVPTSIIGLTYDTVAEAIAAATAANPAAVLGTTYNLTPVSEQVTVYSGSIAATVYPKLVNTSNGSDAFGRPSNVWKYKGTTIYSSTLVNSILTYTTAVSSTALTNAILNAGYTTAASYSVYNNGAVSSLTAAQVATLSGYGTLIEVYGNSTTGAIDRIVIVTTYVGQAVITTTDVAATTTVNEGVITVYMNNGAPAATITASNTTSGFAAVYAAAVTAAASGKTIQVLVTPNGNSATSATALSIAVAETATVTPTSYSNTSTNASSSFVAGGTTYRYSKTYQNNIIATLTPVDVVLDAYGNVIKATTTTTYNYAVVTALGYTTVGITQYPAAELLYTDGTTGTVLTAANYNSNSTIVVGDIVSYSVSSNLYTLVDLNATTVSSQTLSITNGVSRFTWESVNYYANANTVFLVRSGSAGAYTYAAYNGFANVPSLGGSATGAVLHTSSVASVVYITNSTATSATTDTIFFSGVSTPVTTASGTYYVADVTVNGVSQTLNLYTNYVAGIYTSMITTAEGITVLGGLSTIGTPASATLTYTNGVLTIGSAVYAPASTCVVYTYNATTGAVTASSLAIIPSLNLTSGGTTHTYGYLLNSAGTQVTAIFIQA